MAVLAEVLAWSAWAVACFGHLGGLLRFVADAAFTAASGARRASQRWELSRKSTAPVPCTMSHHKRASVRAAIRALVCENTLESLYKIIAIVSKLRGLAISTSNAS